MGDGDNDSGKDKVEAGPLMIRSPISDAQMLKSWLAITRTIEAEHQLSWS